MSRGHRGGATIVTCLEETAASDRELYDEMNKLYPDWASPQAWLMFGLNRESQVRE